MKQLAVDTSTLVNHAQQMTRYANRVKTLQNSVENISGNLKDSSSFGLITMNLRAICKNMQLLSDDFIHTGKTLDEIAAVYVDSIKENLALCNELETNVDAASFDPAAGLTSYEDMLDYRADNAVEEVSRDLYEKYYDKIKIKDDSYSSTAHYNTFANNIEYDAAEDSTDPRGPGSVYYHEVGHLIDDRSDLFGSSSNDGSYDFYDALESDFNKYVSSVMADKGYTNISDAYDDINKWLWNDADMKATVSDIMRGITSGKCSGKWIHDLSYYNEKSICNEAFASFFEAGMSDTNTKLDYIKTVFPNAYDAYLEIAQDALD